MTKYKSFRSIAAFAVLAAASCVAFATDCKNGAPHSSWPDCILPGQPGATTNNAGGGGGGGGGVGVGIAGAEALGFGGGATVSTGPVNASGIGGDLGLSQEQQQAQQQRQGQGQTSQNVNNISTGSSGNYKSTFTAWGLPAFNAQASTVPTAIMTQLIRRCDARVHKITEPVTVLSFGPFGGVYEHRLGFRDRILPVYYNWDGSIGEPFEIIDIWGTDPDGRRAVVGQRMGGHEVYGNGAVLSSSTNRGLNIFGAHETTGGSLGVSGSGSFQQQASQYEVFPCTYRERYVQWIKIEQKTVIAAPKPRPPKPKVYVAPKPKPCIPVQNICRNEGSSSITGLSNTQIK